MFLVSNNDHNKDINNLNIYETRTGVLIKSIVQKKPSDKFVDWSADESVFAYLVSNEIQFYEKSDPSKMINSLKVENLQTFSMHALSNYVAIHASGKKVN